MPDVAAQDEMMNESALKMPSAEREKYWKELDIVEKVERLRAYTKNMFSTVQRIEDEVREFKNVFQKHTHNENGECIVIVKDHSMFVSHMRGLIGAANTLNRLSQEKDEVYI